MASGAEVVFVMPKHTEEGQKIAEGFQKLQDELLQSVDLEWTSQQIAEVRKLQAAGRKIIQKCLDQAKSHPEELKEHIEREAKLAKADKYKQVYGSIHSLIKDDDGFKEACALCQSLQVSAEVKMPEFRQQTNDLSALYMNGCRVKAQFDKIFAEIAEDTGAIHKKGGVKKMWRALEKTGLRADLNLRWRADHICDIIRCMLVYETMQGMRDGLQEIVSRNQKDGQYVVGRVKDRLSQPNAGGWSDVMINLYLQEDARNLYLCEVQIVHTKMLMARKELGAHGAYDVVRFGNELLEATETVDDDAEGAESHPLIAKLERAEGEAVKNKKYMLAQQISDALDEVKAIVGDIADCEQREAVAVKSKKYIEAQKISDEQDALKKRLKDIELMIDTGKGYKPAEKKKDEDEEVKMLREEVAKLKASKEEDDKKKEEERKREQEEKRKRDQERTKREALKAEKDREAAREGKTRFNLDGAAWEAMPKAKGWATHTTILNKPMKEDVAILDFIHMHGKQDSHTLTIFACTRSANTNTFTCRKADRYSVPTYTSETKTRETTKLSTPLIVKKGQYIGVTDKNNLEFCSLRQTNDWSVKENNDEAFYSSNFVDSSIESIKGSKWQGALSFGFNFGSASGKKSNDDVYLDRQLAEKERQRASSVEKRAKAASSAGTPNFVNWSGVQWTGKATTGWSVKTALLGSDPAVHDGVVTKIKIRYRDSGSHALDIMTFDRDGISQNFTASTKVTLPSISHKAKEDLEVEIKPPLKISKGQYIGITSDKDLDCISYNHNNDKSLEKKTIYYQSGKATIGNRISASSWSGRLAIGFVSTGHDAASESSSGSTLASAATSAAGGSGDGLMKHFNPHGVGAVWKAPSSHYKGWGVKTALLGKPAETGGCLKALTVKHFGSNSGNREINVVVMRRGAQTNFEVINLYEIPAYVSEKDVLKTVTFATPLEYSAGDYVGVTSRTTSSLDIMSISGANFEEGKGCQIFYGESRKVGDGVKHLKEWEGALCFGFTTGMTRLNLGHPVWNVPHESVKGWGVKTGILGLPQDKSGSVTNVSIKHFKGGSREINVVVLSRASSTSRYFTVTKEYQIPSYTSTPYGIKNHKLTTPINFSAGDYVGVTSRGPALEIASVSDSQHAAGKYEGSTIFYGDKRTVGDGSKALSEWKGALCISFLSRPSAGIHLDAPVWTAPKEKFKGWFVKSTLLGKALPSNGQIQSVKMMHHAAGSRSINVVVCSRPTPTSLNFTVKETREIPTYESLKDGLKEHVFASPIPFSAGDFVGIVSRDDNPLQVKSISGANHESGKGSNLFYADAKSYSERMKSMKSWEGAVCVGFTTVGGGASAGASGSLNLGHPVWSCPAGSLKGWVVNTSVLGKPMTSAGKLTEFKIQHHDASQKAINVVVMSKNGKSFSIIREHELPAYTSVASGIKTITISPPLSYAAGDYVGMSSRNAKALQVQSCSQDTNSGAVNGATVWYGKEVSGAGKAVTLKEWKGALRFGFRNVA